MDLPNASGRPLSGPAWLEAHHRAKLPERTAFAQRLARYAPSRVIDLGCATGLWLDLLDKVVPHSCELVGVDADGESLELAAARSANWQHASQLIHADFAATPDAVPRGDLILMFNVFSYVADPGDVLASLSRRHPQARIVVRQYDGGTIRVGPLDEASRAAVESSLRASVVPSAAFSHYPMDRTYAAILSSPYAVESLEFELTQRVSPFPPEFVEYLSGTLDWMRAHLSSAAGDALAASFGMDELHVPDDAYFVEVDLTASLVAAAARPRRDQGSP